MSIKIDAPQIDIDRIGQGDFGATRDAFVSLQGVIQQLTVALTQPRIGRWRDVPYVAGNFVGAGGGSWTVDAADVRRYKYVVIDQLLIVDLAVDTTVIAGVVNELRVTLPGGLKAAGTIGSRQGVAMWSGSAGAAAAAGIAAVLANGGGSYFSVQRYDGSAAPNWPTYTDLAVGLVALIEVLPTNLGL